MCLYVKGGSGVERKSFEVRRRNPGAEGRAEWMAKGEGIGSKGEGIASNEERCEEVQAV